MIARLAYAYGIFHATVGCLVFVIVGLALDSQTLGVTKTPLPLVWPLAVLHLAVAQLALRDILGPAERVAVRGRIARSVRAMLVAVLISLGGLTYVSGHGSSAFDIFYVVLAAVAFCVPVLTAADPWPWTLGLGMAAVGLQFVTPWEPVTRVLAPVPLPLALLVVALAVVTYVVGLRPRRPLGLGRLLTGVGQPRTASRASES